MTAELLKDIITIFYSPLAQVYKAASIADSVGDLQNFLNDMIRTVEQVEECKSRRPHKRILVLIIPQCRKKTPNVPSRPSST